MNAKDRARRVRHKLRINAGTRTRLSVFKSLQHVYVQAIDDSKHLTIASASTNFKDFPKKEGNKSEKAKWVGSEIAKKLKALKVKDVYLDRGSCSYAGVIKAFAQAAREGGLNF